MQTFERMMENYRPLQSDLPNSIDLGFCTVDQVSYTNFYLENPNRFPVSYNIEMKDFQISPFEGVINAQSKVRFEIKYTPSEANVIVSNFIINLEHEQPRIIKISAIGKYAFIALSTNKIKFPDLLVGKTCTKEIIVKNSSSVAANFCVEYIQDDNFKDNAFQLSEMKGHVPAKSSYLIKVTYSPQVPNQISTVHYQVICNGGNTCQLECTGKAEKFDVYLDNNTINFGEVKLGKPSSYLLQLHNDSELATNFQFYNNQSNIFSLSVLQGVIKAHSTIRVIVSFNPTNCICYYERVFCVVRNHAVLYIDLLGTCYDLTIQPLKIVQKHIDRFRARVVLGKLSQIDFKYIENSYLLQNPMDSNIMISQQQQSRVQNQIFDVTNCFVDPFPYNQVVMSKELMMKPNDINKLITINVEFLDFGYTEWNTTSGVQDIVLTNKANCKTTIYWTIQKKSETKGKSVFSVHPEIATMQANQSQTFQVNFRPHKNQFYFFQDLQFFAYKFNQSKDLKKNTNLNSTLTKKFSGSMKLTQTLKNTSQLSQQQNVEEMLPPYQGTIKCIGHSFSSSSEPFVPIIEFKPKNNIVFKTCGINENVYQTIEIHNLSDTPTYYQLGQAECFKTYPRMGLVPGKSFNIIMIEFNPTKYKLYQPLLSLYLNYRLQQQKLQLIGYCSQPSLQISNNSELYFPPTYIGVCSKGQLKVQNMSRLELAWKVDVPEKYEQEIDIKPSQGVVKANEIFFLKFEFIPYKKKQYKISCNLQVKEVVDLSERSLVGYYNPSSGKDKETVENIETEPFDYPIEIIGAGSDGSLMIKPVHDSLDLSDHIDFKIVKVNFNKKAYAELQNLSSCTFFVEIQLKYKNKQNNTKTNQQQLLRNNFTLDFEQGIIAAHSKVQIGIMFNPTEVKTFDLVLEVIAKEENLLKNQKFGLHLVQQKCELGVLAQGSYPLLKIVDVRNNAVSVATLWENFQINKINYELTQKLNDEEKLFLNIETLNFQEVQAIQKRLKSYDWNFGYLPSKAQIKPRKIVITIQNIGGTPLDWNFKLPSDSQITVEPWADPGEPTDEDAYQKAIIERNIFQIQPKSGTLQPGKLQDVELIYSPGNFEDNIIYEKKQFKKQNENHFLRVILNILNGKPVVINLKGMTLAPSEGRLALKKNNYNLPNTPIGLLMYVKFPIEIQNVGTSKITYVIENEEVDLDGNTIDSKFKIFMIENPSGILLPGDKQYLYCLFKPLEAKTYYHKLKIIVRDMIKEIQVEEISITGCGYNINPPEQQLIKAEIPSARSFVSPIGSAVFFSIEEIDFGIVQPNKCVHRIIILYNLSKTNKLSFDFNDKNGFSITNNRPGLLCGDEFMIEPLSSTLDAGQFIELKLSLTPAKSPSVYQGEIECTISWIQDDNKAQQPNNIQLEKETLFLRVKKTSSLDVEMINSYKEREFVVNEEKHMFETIFENLINDVVNEHYTSKYIYKGNILKRIENQPIQLYNTFDDEEPANINSVINLNEVNPVQPQSKNMKDYKQQYIYIRMFLEEEFLDLADLIMENSFFNILSETTRKECDLLRISKTFVMPQNRN